MNEMSCEVIRDLLPLYADGALSDESRALVERHLAECGDCREVLSRMKEEIPAPRAEEPGVAEALKGLHRALKRTKFKAIAIAVVSTILVGWLAVTSYSYLEISWTVRVPPQNIVIADLCHTANGAILFHESANDGLMINGCFTQYVDGMIYMDYSRQKINPSKQTWDPEWQDLNTFLRDGTLQFPTSYDEETDEYGDWKELLAIRVGTPEDYVTVWEKGTEIPPASAEAEQWYQDMMNMTTG